MGDSVRIYFGQVDEIYLLTPAIAIVIGDDKKYNYFNLQFAFIHWYLSFSFGFAK